MVSRSSVAPSLSRMRNGPGFKVGGRVMGMRRFLGFSAERPQRRFHHHGVAGMSRRLRRLGSLQLDAAPAGQRVDVQVDALNVAHARGIAVDRLKALPHGKRCAQCGGQLLGGRNQAI